MTYPSGQSILQHLNLLEKQGIPLHRKNDSIQISGKNCRIEIIIKPDRWMGLRFYLLSAEGRNILEYSIDTDLYDFSQSKNLKFIETIEADISDFVDKLTKNEIQFGTIKKKPAVIIPRRDDFWLITRGRLLTTGKSFKKLEDAESQGRFEHLTLL